MSGIHGEGVWDGWIEQETILYDTIMVDRCHYMFFKTHRMSKPWVNPNINCGLWVIIMCQCKFMNLNKYATPVWLLGKVVHVLGEGINGNFVLSAQIFCKLKIVLKKYYFKNIKLKTWFHRYRWSDKNPN